MSKNLSYLTPEGFTIFTSQFHKNRGSCCKSACLHCPFGFTLKKHGIQFEDVAVASFPVVEKILASANEQIEWSSFYPENIKFLKLKGQLIGLILKNHIVIKKLVLLPEFQEQGISREIVESYYFI